jgi:hypothetical protein
LGIAGIFTSSGSEDFFFNQLVHADVAGRCPDLITGIHGNDPIKVYAELCEVVEDVVRHFEQSARPLPKRRTRPMMEMAEA